MNDVINATLNIIDQTLQSVTPTVMVPLHETLHPLVESGHRFLSAGDGLWLELRRPWLHAILPVSLQDTVAMPYGKVEQRIDLACGRIPFRLVKAFIDDAFRSPDTEIAGGVIWNESTRAWRYERFEAMDASGNHVHYTRPRLGDGEHLVVDLHSHGPHGAFFSEADDADDRGEAKIAMVFGVLAGEGKPELAVRLCAMGIYVPINPDDMIGQEADHG